MRSVVRARRSREPKHARSLHDRALGLLAVRPRSRSELRSRLLRAGFEAEEVDAELLRLEDVGLIDDERFALALAEHETHVRHSGSRAVAGALRAKGVAPATVARVLEEHSGDEEKRAMELARSRAGRMAGLDPATAFRRLSGLLSRRGYAPDLARRAARRALELDPAGE